MDIAKLRERERLTPWDDSLAKKVETENDLARTYIDYLLGRVVCCTHVSQLRKHKTAITVEGMVYQGYVARPLRKELMEDAFIGRRAVALRIERLEAERKAAETELAGWKPVAAELAKHKGRESLFSRYFVHDTVEQRRADHQRRLEIAKEMEQLEDELSHLDLFWLEEQRRQIGVLEQEIKDLDRRKIQFNSEKTQIGRAHV